MSQVWERTPEQKAWNLKPYIYPLYPLTPEDLDYFWTRYELSTTAVSGSIIRTVGPRYVLPIFAPNGEVRGHTARVGWKDSPLTKVPYGPDRKALTYMSKAQPVQSFYPSLVTGEECPLVIVEDQLSAIKLRSTGLYSAVALLGVPNGGNIGADRVREIARVACSEVIVALDADATENAFQFVRKYGMAFKRIRIAILDKDLKDTPKACFKEVLGT